MDVDAIVNAANTDLQRGGGVCGAIFKAAGPQELEAACDKLAPINTGDAVITPGFRLPARFVIHTPGPVYRRWSKEQNEKYLRSCYTNSLNLAAENGCNSIAFPLISSGIYGYPKKEALAVATSAIIDWLKEGELDVYLTVFDKEAFTVSEELLGNIKSYIDEHYVDTHRIGRERLRRIKDQALNAAGLKEFDYDSFNPPAASPDYREFEEAEHNAYGAALTTLAYHESRMSTAGLDDLIGNLDEPFSDTLLRLIDAKGKADVDVYKKANIDRKLFSKIRTGKGYAPSKRTAIALAVALELTPKETEDLLRRAGFALSHSQMFDVIVEYFIVNGRYNIFEINEVLFRYDQPLLGG
jgi:O-acetyl-ADP-ribose deacetylase (regulator of RNase III)